MKFKGVRLVLTPSIGCLVDKVYNVSECAVSFTLPKPLYSVHCGRGDNAYDILEVFAGFDIETTNVQYADGWYAFAYHMQICLSNQREKCVEHDERSQRSEITLVVSADIVPDHIARTQQQMRERPLGVVVEERNAVERALVEIAAFAAAFRLLRFWFLKLPPGQESQILPHYNGTPADFPGMLLLHLIQAPAYSGICAP